MLPKKTTCRKVLKLTDANPGTPAEKQAHRFPRQGKGGSLKDAEICDRLRYHLYKNWNHIYSFGGTVKHTCGSVFELLCSYNSHLELRVEMENVL